MRNALRQGLFWFPFVFGGTVPIFVFLSGGSWQNLGVLQVALILFINLFVLELPYLFLALVARFRPRLRVVIWSLAMVMGPFTLFFYVSNYVMGFHRKDPEGGAWFWGIVILGELALVGFIYCLVGVDYLSRRDKNSPE